MLKLGGCLLIGFLSFASFGHADDTWNVMEKDAVLNFSLDAGGALKGGFRNWQANITLDPAFPEKGHVSVTIDMASAFLSDQSKIVTMVSETWLDVVGYPKAKFEGKAFILGEGDRFSLPGTLTIKGTAHPMNLEGRMAITGNEMNVSFNTQVKRIPYMIGSAQDPVSPDVDIEISFTALREEN